MIHLFYDRIDFITYHIPCLELGSIPEEGSSKNIIFEFPIKAFAKQSFLLFPPDKFLASLPFSAAKAHSLIVCSMFASISES